MQICVLWCFYEIALRENSWVIQVCIELTQTVTNQYIYMMNCVLSISKFANIPLYSVAVQCTQKVKEGGSQINGEC